MSNVLFPDIKPYNQDYLRVSDIHEIFYREYGNPAGIPILWLHGGPGACCYDYDARYLNPERYRIILLDQRGAGKSRPFCALEENNTQALIADLERLRGHLRIDQWCLLGGSWGSFLALAYSIMHYERVLGLVLRGAFTATKAESANLWYGMRDTFPDAWQELQDLLPKWERDDLAASYVRRILHNDPAVHMPAIKAFVKYDTICAYLSITQSQLAESLEDQIEMIGLARVFAHYYVNSFFIKNDSYILDNLHKISHLPCFIVHGRYDVICKPKTAYDLHRQWPGSELCIVERAGHSSREDGIKHGIMQAADKLYNVLSM